MTWFADYTKRNRGEKSAISAIGFASHSEGSKTQSLGDLSHAEGNASQSIGNFAHAEGSVTSAIGNSSHSEGTSTIASGDNQHVQGKYNIADTTSAFIIGNGDNSNARSNAITVDWSGNTEIAGYCIYHPTLEITTANVSTYYVTGSSYNTLYIPYGYDTVIYSAPTAGTIDQVLIVDNIATKNNKMFNGYKLNIIAVGGSYMVRFNTNVPIGYFSYWVGDNRKNTCGQDTNTQQVSAFDEFIYYNGLWVCKSY